MLILFSLHIPDLLHGLIAAGFQFNIFKAILIPLHYACPASLLVLLNLGGTGTMHVSDKETDY